MTRLAFLVFAACLFAAPAHAQYAPAAPMQAAGVGAGVAVGMMAEKAAKSCRRHPVLCSAVAVGAGLAIKHARDRDLALARQQEATDAPITPPGFCPEERHSLLSALVNNACKGALAACSVTDLRVTLLVKAGAFKACAQARMKREDECYRGGDQGHRMQIQQMWQAHDRCQTLAGLQ